MKRQQIAVGSQRDFITMTERSYTTIAIDHETRDELKEMKIISAESYDNCIQRLIDFYNEQNNE